MHRLVAPGGSVGTAVDGGPPPLYDKSKPRSTLPPALPVLSVGEGPVRTSGLPWVVACSDYSPKAALAQTTTLRQAQGTAPARLRLGSPCLSTFQRYTC